MKNKKCEICGCTHRDMTSIWKYGIGSKAICMPCYNDKYGARARRRT